MPCGRSTLTTENLVFIQSFEVSNLQRLKPSDALAVGAADQLERQALRFSLCPAIRAPMPTWSHSPG
jgi:hypothetical protein